ncbi:hypothetical protein [Pseudomonas laurylsulfatiphila]|uniref:hypothetical protein n=1 Tax=Pseudomonas laurylsulfatiphila TaxID=2011015 RepID=UPI0021609583|nr:hypothetical protein [Pseudomonas laurylsulfatiphila]UVM04688.1 hypothetical protein LOY25_27440 [Pseudomonas laurylsulfatiphila]
MTYLVQTYARRTSQPSANKLSTSPPTAIGDNCGNAGYFLHENQKKRDLSSSLLPRVDWSFFDLKPESHGLKGVQRMANTLSTEAPTDFGVNLKGSVENR